ncbi:Deoxyuridine 5'-triphosphate nucleotidohydrolase [Halotydeus destructor]|nr:Deoxyuridine 5'-triphosphate nucleotidohydrolase [Halotydeus destructor]
MSLTFLVKTLEAGARHPTRAVVHCVALDVYSCEHQIIEKFSNQFVSTGMSLIVPEGHYGRVTDCIGFPEMFGIRVCGGILNPTDKSALKILLCNNRDIPFQVKQGDRIARIEIERSLADILVGEVEYENNGTEQEEEVETGATEVIVVPIRRGE